MSVIVVAEFPTTEQGAQDFIDWSKSDDGYVITRQHKGFEDIRKFFGWGQKNNLLIWKMEQQRRSSSLFRL